MKNLLYIEWEDAFGCPAGWEFEDEAEIETTKVTSVGWKIKETDSVLFISPHRSKPSSGRRQLAGHIAIPKRQIIKRSKVRL